MNIKRAISTALAVILVVTPHPQEVSAASFCQEYHLLKDTYNAWASRDDVVKLLGVNPDSHTFDDIYIYIYIVVVTMNQQELRMELRSMSICLL